MAEAVKLNELCSRASDELKQATREERAGAYARLAATLTDVDADLRETVQRETTGALRKILEKLGGKAPLTSEETAIVRLWIVGDAESYLAAEDDSGEWRNDLGRIVAELDRMRSSSVSVTDATRLRGLVHDAIRTAWDLHNYLESKERVESFSETTRELDAQEQQILKEILEKKLAAGKM
jgi:DNA repair exonuclease SbcCD nuclease subunit